MKILRNLSLASIIFLSFSANAQNGLDNPITKAVMEVYEQQLKANPTDYETYFKRANEFYRHNIYMRALDDINKALEYTPASESDMRMQSYLLRANIYEQLKQQENALSDINSALALSPQDYVLVYQRANLEYELGQYNEAKKDYQRMQNLNRRSTESLIGLARVAVKENNLGLATEYIDEAVSLDPSNAESYVRRASVKQLMGDDTGAVDDLLLALSTDKNNSKALRNIVEMGNTNYGATITSLSNAIKQAPEVGMFYYLRAVIAQAHYNYGAAIADFNKIINDNLYNYYGIYASLADCYYALGQFDLAQTNIDTALSMTKDNCELYTTKAKIQRAKKDYDGALSSATRAVAINSSSIEALIQKGLALVSQSNYTEASQLFGEATMLDSESPYNYMLRAWLLNSYLNQPVAANSFYERILDIETYDKDDVKSLVGFAKLYSGDAEGAEDWMQKVLSSNTDADGYINYLGACYYAQIGNYSKAFECMEKSLKNGYANYYDWMYNTDARMNVEPIRNQSQFSNLLNQHQLIFNY